MMMTKEIYTLFKPQAIGLKFDLGMLFFRITVSLSMINTHGLKKLMNFEETVRNIPDPLGIGGELSTYLALLANIICPICVILGIATRLAAFQILTVTLVGLFVVHYADPWHIKDVPLMYSLSYLLIFFFGAGKYSIDNKIFKTIKTNNGSH